MKLPSIASLVSGAVSTFTRFPLAIVSAVIATVCCMAINHRLDYHAHYWYWNVIMSAYLCMLLQNAVVVFVEKKETRGSMKMSAQLFAALLCVLYYYSLPGHFTEVGLIRFVLIALALHLLIAFVPFTGGGEQNGFWQYNKIIFLRILTSLLYTLVLYLGLYLALIAIEHLFNINIQSKLYGDLWFFLTGVFNSWFFLAGFPSDYPTLDRETDYPKGLKIFTQYVLLSILVVYLGILYAYTGKIILTAQWPVGWVSYLILGFSIAGILSLLLIYPVRNKEGNKWMLIFSRFFYFALFPLIILLCFAIRQRVMDYGITELRYFILLLAAWLLFIAIYFLVYGQKNIKLIPASLCLLAFLSSFGPWGAFDVSRASQLRRLTGLLKADKLLVNGKVIKVTEQPSFHDRRELSAITDYLVSTHGYRVLQPYFTQNLDSIMRRDSLVDSGYVLENEANPSPVGKELFSLLNITYVEEGETENNKTHKYEYSWDEADTMMDIHGYNYFIKKYRASRDDTAAYARISYKLGSDSINIHFGDDSPRLLIQGFKELSVNINMDSVFHKLYEKRDDEDGYAGMKQDDMTLYILSGPFICKLILTEMNGERTDSTFRTVDFDADIYIGRKQ